MKKSSLFVCSALFFGGIAIGLGIQKYFIVSKKGIFIEPPALRISSMPQKTSAQEFVQHFYGLIFAINQYDEKNRLIFLYFTDDLAKKYEAVDAQEHAMSLLPTPEGGCLNDFNIFMNTQEVYNGFVVGKPLILGNGIVRVPVSFYFSDKLSSNRISVELEQRNNQWKIRDLIYSDNENASLAVHIQQCMR